MEEADLIGFSGGLSKENWRQHSLNSIEFLSNPADTVNLKTRGEKTYETP